MITILLLTFSNIFMTIAWYGHLKYKDVTLWKVVLASWLIAFVEYCFQVPANRIGSVTYTTAQLKTIQEVITLVVFSVFSVLYLKESFRWNYAVGFGLISVGAFFVFKKWCLGSPGGRNLPSPSRLSLYESVNQVAILMEGGLQSALILCLNVAKGGLKSPLHEDQIAQGNAQLIPSTSIGIHP